MHLRGKYQYEIAKALGLSQGMICQDMKKIKARWQEKTTLAIDEAKAKELAKLDHLERQYWLDWERYLAAWEASKTERTKKRQRKGTTGAIDASIETEQRDGNPAFLDGMLRCKDGILRCQERRCKLLGLDAPSRQELTGANGGPIQVDDIHITDEQRISRITELLDRARARGIRPTPDE